MSKQFLPGTKTKKVMYACMNASGWAALDTLSYNRETSIDKLVKNSTIHPKRCNWPWFKSKGWRCHKVNVTLEFKNPTAEPENEQ